MRCKVTLPSYFVLPPLQGHVAGMGSFIETQHWYTDYKDPFARTQAFMDYDGSLPGILVQESRSFVVGLSDESGAASGTFLLFFSSPFFSSSCLASHIWIFLTKICSIKNEIFYSFLLHFFCFLPSPLPPFFNLWCRARNKYEESIPACPVWSWTDWRVHQQNSLGGKAWRISFPFSFL